ncbi:hypothetical protein [Sediminimonas sp.]|uniref:hypothetical protein n=1 Tax=Sediminimonas sp. TaxID=2823379 RepID=UPI0025CC8F3E|nr:hypothetical protein [Sediminimonas sp.]
MVDKDERSILNFEITAEHGSGKLRVVIPWFTGKPGWQGSPGHLIGAYSGIPYWKGNELGLFSADGGPQTERPFAVLVAPPEGLDDAPFGTTGVIRFHDGTAGTWKKIKPAQKPEGTTQEDFQGF